MVLNVTSRFHIPCAEYYFHYSHFHVINALNMKLPLTFICCDSQVKWHEICLSTPAAILEVLNAWENGVLSVEAVQVCSTLMFLLFFSSSSFRDRKIFREISWVSAGHMMLGQAVPVTSLTLTVHVRVLFFLHLRFDTWLKRAWRILWKLTSINVQELATAVTFQSSIDVPDFSFFPCSIQVFISRNVEGCSI